LFWSKVNVESAATEWDGEKKGASLEWRRTKARKKVKYRESTIDIGSMAIQRSSSNGGNKGGEPK